MDIKNIVISTAKDSKRIHAFNIQSENKRTVCSLEMLEVGPFRFDAFMDHKDACATCKRQVNRWMAAQ